jgi:hypothetical protein
MLHRNINAGTIDVVAALFFAPGGTTRVTLVTSISPCDAAQKGLPENALIADLH